MGYILNWGTKWGTGLNGVQNYTIKADATLSTSFFDRSTESWLYTSIVTSIVLCPMIP